MQIAILDGYTTNPGDQTWAPIRKFGNLTVHDRTPRERIVSRAEGADVVITNKTPLSAEILDALEELEFVSILATGYDNVDVEYARRLGVPVSNVPEYASDSVAEHTIGLILELARGVGAHTRAVERGEWSDCPDFSFWNQPIRELFDRTLGIVGFGRIGHRVGEVASALGMPVLGSTRSSTPEPDFDRFERVDTRELLERAEVVSLHCPLTEETAGMIDGEALAAMRDDAYLVNTARGELVVERDLVRALESGTIAGAAVDVVSEEPLPPDHPLLDCDDCLITPHNAWASFEARRRLIRATADNLEAFAAGAPIHVVNPKKAEG